MTDDPQCPLASRHPVLPALAISFRLSSPRFALRSAPHALRLRSCLPCRPPRMFHVKHSFPHLHPSAHLARVRPPPRISQRRPWQGPSAPPSSFCAPCFVRAFVLRGRALAFWWGGDAVSGRVEAWGLFADGVEGWGFAGVFSLLSAFFQVPVSKMGQFSNRNRKVTDNDA